MARKIFPLLFAAALCLSFSFDGIQSSFAKDSDLKPEDVVAAHLKSIGRPEVLAGIKNRGISGIAKVNFLQGGSGTMEGQALIMSAGPDLGLIMKFDSVDYPGEHIAYDGSEVTVSYITPGQRSPLGDFIYRYNFIVKEGLLGGVLNVGWPLLDLEKKNPTLKYNRAKFEGKEVHELQYIARSGMNNVTVKLFFDLDTFHHVGTEYRLRVESERALQAGKTVTEGVPRATEPGVVTGAITRPAGILDLMQNSHYLLVEKFGNFKELKFGKGSEIKTLTLPYSYTIEYSNEGEGSTFLANWSIDVAQIIQNGKIHSSYFKAP